MVGKRDYTAAIRRIQADDGKGPLHDAGFYIFKALDRKLPYDRGLLHSKGIVAALEVVVGQNGAADDGQVRVRTQEVMGEEVDEVKELLKCGLFDLHRHVLAVEDNAVLVVVDIRGILEAPLAAVDGQRDDPVIFPGRMVYTPCVSLIFHAELALGVGGLLGISRCGDGLGVLLRLRKVDRDVQGPVVSVDSPLKVPGHPGRPDIVRLSRKVEEVVGRRLRGFLVFFKEDPLHLGRPGGEAVHEAGVEEVPVDDRILAESPLHGFRKKVA